MTTFMQKSFKIGIIILIIFLVLWGSYFIYSNITSLLSASLPGGEQTVAPSSGAYPWDTLKSRNTMEEVVDSQQTSTSNSESDTSSRLVIKTGSLSMIVENVMDSAKKVVEYAKSKNGWVVSSSVGDDEPKPLPLAGTENSGTPTSAYVTIRVPAENFDEAMDYIRSLAQKVKTESTQNQDITEEYTDLESRLRNLEAAEKELLKIMERSGEISDVLAVQRELNNMREQIEQIKGRMQYLKQSVEMSSITANLALSEDQLPIEPGDKWRPKYVLQQAWNGVLNFVKVLSYFFIWLIVYAVIWLPIIAIVWLIVKYWRKRGNV
jgi:cell division protein FtsL